MRPHLLRRNVTAIGSNWPIYRIDETGHVHELGELEAVERNGYCVAGGPVTAAASCDRLDGRTRSDVPDSASDRHFRVFDSRNRVNGSLSVRSSRGSNSFGG